jgi:adenylate kinase family enzyme
MTLAKAVRIAILGNSGSGKSTLAKTLAADRCSAILDLDTIAWVPDQIAVLREPAEALADIERFCTGHEAWVVEGCYGDLIAATLVHGPELILLDPGEQACLDHCRARPWEPHKYASKAEQDAQLEFLLDWVRAYYVRDGDMSAARHRAIFDAYAGPNRWIRCSRRTP